MAFWGIEVKPGKPYVLPSDDLKGRLHISQATLGSGSSTKKSIVQCKVGDNDPIYLCSLLPEKLETCGLNHEFEEDEEVSFSIVGPHSVHLSGFFYGDDEGHDCMEHDYGSDGESDSSEEGIMGMDYEDDDDSISYDSDDEDEDVDFDMYPPSSVPNSGVKIEEIVDDEKPTNENGLSKRAKKKKTQSSMSDDNENSNRQIVVKAGTGVPILESEDEDGFPISARENKSDISKAETKVEENTDDNVTHGKKLKRKSDAADQDGKPARETISENEVKQKKNKKKKVAEKVESAQENEISIANGTEETPVVEIGTNMKPSEKKKEKKKKKQNKQQENVAIPNAEDTDKKGPVSAKQEKEAKSLQVRTFPNGLMIEELAMGKPNGKRASPGNKVSVHYIGKLKKNGKIFDSNIGRAPFKFRLGIGQVIKGWDVGVNGMRVGDKRRLTIPPAMGYGAKGAGPDIPPNAWLVFDVELVGVN